jgi:hypothetical protein
MFAQVARVFNLSLITSENALFFFDSMIAASIERTMTIADVQLNGLVALLVASKMYGTCPQFKVVSGLIPLPSLPRFLFYFNQSLVQITIFFSSTLDISFIFSVICFASHHTFVSASEKFVF